MGDIHKDYPFRSVLSLKPLIDYLEKTLKTSSMVKPCMSGDFRDMLSHAPELTRPIEDETVLERHKDIVQQLMAWVLPPLYWETEAMAAVVPFSMKPFFVTPLFKSLFVSEDASFHGGFNLDQELINQRRVIRAYLFILEKFYGIRQDLDYPIIRIVPDPETGLDRHYKIKFDFRFVEPLAVKEPKVLTAQEQDYILDHLIEPEVIREILPPEDFELHGFVVFHAVDVTESEVLLALERDLIEHESIISQGGFLRLQDRLRTLFRRPDLMASLAAFQEDQVLLLNTGLEMSKRCIFADSHHVPVSQFEGTVYERAVQSGEILRVPDILEEPSSGHTEEEILQMGMRSLIIAPLHYKGESMGTLDIRSPRPRDLGPMDTLLMGHIQPIFSLAIKRALDDLENRVQGVIKQECTAIHPAVEWRFRKAAFHHLEHLRMGDPSEIEPIVFKDVYPFYGVSDIRGSTRERNRAIQRDLVEHLKLALNVVRLAIKARPLLILRELAGRIEKHLNRIQAALGTGDELSIAQFLRQEVESVFFHLKGFGPRVNRAIEAYESAVDPHMGTVYRMRKEFEDSVSTLNEKLANYLDEEEAEAQAIFPHFFERHRTDGVNYLIYMGASLMEDGEFNELYLRNLRLWQIKVACGIAWHTEQLKSSLRVPLDTAHLILVQNTPLSIRFRYDEKRFDVDGAYDIQQEIIKSRLDKAVVKGAGDRLTQPGKIAIVYSHTEEAREVLRHIEFLQSEGFLNGERETLELEDLPGLQGLKSLRVGVNLESQALSQQFKRIAS